ncbi:hypothetical protein BC830DRAFT_92236 [Chytriomyces sp. MP71]|nr:hypothetical protein BC830DRAFT_92236 [Chytriomyces sp. MP71]
MASGSSSGSITSVGSATLESAELAFPILSAATRASPVRECEFGGATRVPPPTDARPAAGRAPFQPQSRTRCPSQPSKQERKLKPSAHTSAATKLSKRSRATQHPPPFVVRHLDQNDRLPDDLPNPGTARPPPVRSRSSTRQHFTVKHGSDGRATPGLESDARGARGGGRGQDQLAKKNPRVDPREPLHHASSRALDPAIKQFNLQKSEILRFIHRVKAEYPRHIASPYRRV